MRSLWLSLGYLWALPITAFGWLCVLFGGARFIETDALWCRHYIALPTGRAAHWMIERGFGAFNSGAVIIYRDIAHSQSVRMRRHELEHYAQTRRWGLFWVPIYYGHWALLAMQGRDGYRENVFEVGARAAEVSA